MVLKVSLPSVILFPRTPPKIQSAGTDSPDFVDICIDAFGRVDVDPSCDAASCSAFSLVRWT